MVRSNGLLSPLDVEEYEGRWNYDASVALFLSLMSDNSGDHYSITATQNEKKLSVLDEGDDHIYYPFEPLQDDAQLNNGVGILERVS